jgi:foldase protein PrsA
MPKKSARKSAKITSSKKNFLSNLPVKTIPLKSFIIAGIVIVAILLIGYFKNQFIVATVNGEPVTRIQLLTDLEKKQGKEALNNIITERLVLQEAQKKDISITETEVDDQIKEIEKNLESQGQKLDTLLAAQNVSRKDLRDQIKIQLILKKIVGPADITDKEIADFIETNRELLPESTDQATLDNQVKQQLEQQKTGEKIQSLVAELQQKAKIEYLLPL